MQEISEEAKAVNEAVYNNIYPPINPAVLLATARELYLAGAPQNQIVDLLAWTLYVMTSQNPGSTTPDQKMAIVQLHFAKRMPR